MNNRLDSIIEELMTLFTDRVEESYKNDSDKMELALLVMINLVGVFVVTMSARQDDHKLIKENSEDMIQGIKEWFDNATNIIKKGNKKNDGH